MTSKSKSQRTELLDHYFARNSNLVVISGHLGNWEMLNLFASAKLSYQIVVVYHELTNAVESQKIAACPAAKFAAISITTRNKK